MLRMNTLLIFSTDFSAFTGKFCANSSLFELKTVKEIRHDKGVLATRPTIFPKHLITAP